MLIDDIEEEDSKNNMSASQVFTHMLQHVHKPCLFVLQDGKRYSEGDEILIGTESVKIKHITSTGFLYNWSPSRADDFVIVVTEDKNRKYYADWDYLEFVRCETGVSEG